MNEQRPDVAELVRELGAQSIDACRGVLRALERALPECSEEERKVVSLIALVITATQLEAADARALSEAEIVQALRVTPCAKCGHLLPEHGVLACMVLTCPCRSWEPPRA